MWRTFWKEVSISTKELDEFLNSIEEGGFEPRFLERSSKPNGVVILIVTARKKDA